MSGKLKEVCVSKWTVGDYNKDWVVESTVDRKKAEWVFYCDGAEPRSDRQAETIASLY